MWARGDVAEPSFEDRLILQGLASGWTKPQIAAHLDRDEEHVAERIRHLELEWRVNGSVALVVIALERDWIGDRPWSRPPMA